MDIWRQQGKIVQASKQHVSVIDSVRESDPPLLGDTERPVVEAHFERDNSLSREKEADDESDEDEHSGPGSSDAHKQANGDRDKDVERRQDDINAPVYRGVSPCGLNRHWRAQLRTSCTSAHSAQPRKRPEPGTELLCKRGAKTL